MPILSAPVAAEAAAIFSQMYHVIVNKNGLGFSCYHNIL
jgi:hypothetical protein